MEPVGERGRVVGRRVEGAVRARLGRSRAALAERVEDSRGRFFDDVDGELRCGRSLLDVGVEAAMGDIRFDLGRYAARGAKYDWGKRTPATRLSLP